MISYDNALHGIALSARPKNSDYVCFANVHMVIEAYSDSAFAHLDSVRKFIHGNVQDKIAELDAICL